MFNRILLILQTRIVLNILVINTHFQILLIGAFGVVTKSGWGSPIFVFYCIFMIQFFEVIRGGT